MHTAVGRDNRASRTKILRSRSGKPIMPFRESMPAYLGLSAVASRVILVAGRNPRTAPIFINGTGVCDLLAVRTSTARDRRPMWRHRRATGQAAFAYGAQKSIGNAN